MERVEGTGQVRIALNSRSDRKATSWHARPDARSRDGLCRVAGSTKNNLTVCDDGAGQKHPYWRELPLLRASGFLWVTLPEHADNTRTVVGRRQQMCGLTLARWMTEPRGPCSVDADRPVGLTSRWPGRPHQKTDGAPVGVRGG